MKISTLIILTFCIYSFTYSQNLNQNSFSIDIFGGKTTPLKDITSFVENGNSAGITFRKRVSTNLSLAITGNYNSFLVKDELNSITNNWSSSSITLGPQYNFNFLMFSVGLYGKIGYSFLSIPQAELFFPETQIITSKFDNKNSTTLDSRLGVNLSFKVFNGISIIGNYDYTTNLNNKVDFQARNISSAINEKGRINYDVADQIPFENKNFGFSSMNFSIGISINICGSCTHNVSRNIAPDILRRNNPAGNGNSYPTHAQDWNSSRSNKTSKTSRVGTPNGNGNNDPTKAQDWNSSRSNKTSKGS